MPKPTLSAQLRAFIADALLTIDHLELLILRVALFAILVRELLRLWTPVAADSFLNR